MDSELDGVTMYADDLCAWGANSDQVVVKRKLYKMSAKLLSYALGCSLSLNAAKTQLVWAGTASPLPITIGSSLVQPQEELLLLGVSFYRKLSILPHQRSLLGSVRSILALTRWLLIHLHKGQQVHDVALAMIVRRLCSASLLFLVYFWDEGE